MQVIKKICIVTTRHISYNPRVLKEADAFFNEGYIVTVVTINNHNDQNTFDKKLMEGRGWQLKTVNFRREAKTEKFLWLYLSLKQKLFIFLARFSFKWGIAERASFKAFDELVGLAKRQKADFYLVHHAEALAIGYKAALVTNTRLGFDAEDFHTGMNESGQITREDALISFLEKKYLRYCTYFTAASKGIGEAYSTKYGITEANVIHNVFPREELPLPAIHQPVRFYWYSQVIGPNRSLETLLESAAKISQRFEIHLRGSFHTTVYETQLRSMVRDLNLEDKVFFHLPILAEELINDAAKFDVGLALESDISINRNICVTNKVFSYLMSGLAIVGTDTSGQKDIFSHFGDAVIICKKNNVNDLARAMLFYIENSQELLKAKRAARIAADEQFNWENERKKFITNFKQNLEVPLRRQSSLHHII